MQLRALLEPLLRRDQLDQCMEEEMRFHIEERAADLHHPRFARHAERGINLFDGRIVTEPVETAEAG